MSEGQGRGPLNPFLLAFIRFLSLEPNRGHRPRGKQDGHQRAGDEGQYKFEFGCVLVGKQNGKGRLMTSIIFLFFFF